MEKIAELFGVSLVWLLVLSGIAYFFREALRTWIAGKINHDNAEKLERLKSDLSSEKHRIGSLESTLLSHHTNRRNIVAERRIHALEEIWKCTCAIQRYEFATHFLKKLDLELALKNAETTPTDRQNYEAILPDPKNINLLDDYRSAQLERPFLPPLVWASYQAYEGIIGRTVLISSMLIHGINKPEILTEGLTKDLILKALPQAEELLKSNDTNIEFHLLTPLRDQLLEEIRNSLEGKEEDQQDKERIKALIELTNSVRTTSDQETNSPK